MAQPKYKPWAQDTVLCDGGWKKGMALWAKGDDDFSFGVTESSAQSEDAVALTDCLDGEYGLVCFGGIVPVRVSGYNVMATEVLIGIADGMWRTYGTDPGEPSSCKALVNYDLRNLTGLVTALFIPTWTKDNT